MITRKLYLLIFLIFFAAVLNADVKLDALLLKMENSEKTIQTLEFVFTQDMTYKLTNEKQSIEGSVSFKKPNKIKYRQANPVEQHVISNGKKVWIYSPMDNQVITDSWSKWTKNSMIPGSLMNFGETVKDLKKNYAITYAGTEGNSEVIVLNPKKEEDWNIKMWINKEDFTVQRTMLVSEGIVVNTVMSKYKINPKLSNELFDFNVPAGAQLLEMP